MDISIANWIYATFGDSAIFANIAKIITYLGNKWVIIAIALILLCFKKTRKLGFYIGCACAFAYILNDYILKEIIKRNRPFVDNSELEKIANLAKYELPDGFSMASGHAVVSMTLAFMVFMFNRKYGIISIVFSILIGVSRIALCVHYLSDVLVGFIIGIICALIVYYILNFALNIYLKNKKKISKKIIFASNNSHKLNEVRQILDAYEVLSLKDIGFSQDIEENGNTLAENAQIKARAIKKYCDENNINFPIFSDDSGLFVDALNGEPGVYSARYSKTHDDEANRQKVLKALKRKKNRNAYFECVVCLIFNDEEYLFSGKTFGTILKEYQGDTSFGYDCIFYSDDLKKSFGDARKNEKDSVSHRGRAVREMKKFLENK